MVIDGVERDGVAAELHGATEYYELGNEADRLDSPQGRLEFERSQEIVLRALPPAPAVVADIGGGPGRYALWLASLGYHVIHRDIVPLHVRQLAEAAAAAGVVVDSALGDARALDLADASADAVLLLGPLYHLDAAGRLRALAEARRVVRPGGPVLGAAISRWAARLDGVLGQRLYEKYPQVARVVDVVEQTGVLEPLFPGSFCAFTHRPEELRAEISSAGLKVTDLVCVEGAALLLGDLAERAADPAAWQIVLDAARALERVPELIGLGSHLVVTGRRAAG
jgi:SAM-dependent methyltransferase